jgi:polar amino acid transport system substrate-binding protein
MSTRFRAALALAALVLVALAAGCGSSSSGSGNGGTGSAGGGGGAQVPPPSSVQSAGKLVFCSDITYPPEEYYQGTTAVGSDIDIANAIGKLMGVKVDVQNTGFDGIIAALLSKKCDAIISGMTDTKEREKQISFARYANVGMSLMVPKGNPKNISDLASLSGHSVAVEVGTTEKDALSAENTKLQAQGKKPISIQIYAKDTDAITALVTGKVDAYFADAPPVAYYLLKQPGKFQTAGSQIAVAPIGIAVRKSDTELLSAFRTAIHKLYANGQMKQIFDKWHMSSFAGSF